MELWQVLINEALGGPSRTRTCDLLVRSQTLYPTELWAPGSEPRMLTLMQPLVEEPAIAQQRRQPHTKLACITHIVRVKPRRARATMCQPRKHDRRESCARGSGAIAQRRFEKAHHALRMDGKVGAVPPRPLYQPLAIHARSNQLHRIGLD